VKEHVWITGNGQRLSAMVHIAESFRQGTPVIICCHGFTGDKIGANQMNRRLAEKLECLGYGVVRFDYRGSGDSDGCFTTQTSTAGYREDLAAVIGWVKGQAQFSRSSIVLYGHSLGGLIALSHPADPCVAGRVVLAPVVHPVENFRDIILGPAAWEGSRTGEVVAQFFGKGFSLGPQFVADLLASNYDPITAAARLDTPLLIVHGVKDEVVPIAGSEELARRYAGDKTMVVLEADHVVTGAQGVLQETVARWLQEKFPVEGCLPKR